MAWSISQHQRTLKVKTFWLLSFAAITIKPIPTYIFILHVSIIGKMTKSGNYSGMCGTSYWVMLCTQALWLLLGLEAGYLCRSIEKWGWALRRIIILPQCHYLRKGHYRLFRWETNNLLRRWRTTSIRMEVSSEFGFLRFSTFFSACPIFQDSIIFSNQYLNFNITL